VARKRIVADLEAQGLLGGVKDHTNNIGHCDRCKTVVEPRLSTQWFVKIQPLAEKAIAAVKPDAEGNKAIRFTPENTRRPTSTGWKTSTTGASRASSGGAIAFPPGTAPPATRSPSRARVDPDRLRHCGSDQITQETDVLDTWFSSGLLPVSVFGWPNFTPGPSHAGENREDRADFDAFYPTSLLVTGFDILFFWVARMIMLGCWFAGTFPCPTAARARSPTPSRSARSTSTPWSATPTARKMSKTKGNVVDPIEIVKQYGTDAVRFTLASMASPGTDIAFNVARTEGYRAFANKIWNAARFIFMNVDRAAEDWHHRRSLRAWRNADRRCRRAARSALDRRRTHATRQGQSVALENYRFDEAANTIYQFFWGSFCDWYLEIVKLRLDFAETADKAATKGALTTLVRSSKPRCACSRPSCPSSPKSSGTRSTTATRRRSRSR
jgi:valyl-tRNA synthetase